jgi:hypothetical protein
MNPLVISTAALLTIMHAEEWCWLQRLWDSGAVANDRADD